MTLTLTSAQKQRAARKSRPRPVQFDMFGVPPAPVAQSPRAAAIATETMMQAEARRTLAAKATKAAKPKAAKPRVRVMKP